MRDDDELLGADRARRVGLRPADHDAVVGALDDVQVEVGVVLLAGRLERSPLTSVTAAAVMSCSRWKRRV